MFMFNYGVRYCIYNKENKRKGVTPVVSKLLGSGCLKEQDNLLLFTNNFFTFKCITLTLLTVVKRRKQTTGVLGLDYCKPISVLNWLLINIFYPAGCGMERRLP